MAAVTSAFAALALATTYPLGLQPGTHLPSDLGDPLLNAWTLAWDADRMRHGLAGLWNAPNFFPYARTLAHSDHLLGIAMFTAPLQWLTRSPILVHNVAYLGSVMLSGIGMYVLARGLTGRRDAAVIAGVIYACLPFRTSHLAHLQWLMTGWLPLGLWALHRYFATGIWRHLAASAVCFFLQATTASYFLYFAAIPFAVVGVGEMSRGVVPVRRLALHLVPIVLLLAAAIMPIVRTYYAVRQEGLRRSREDIASHSADIADYLHAAPQLRVWGGLGTTGGEHDLFPGALAIALAAVALIAQRRAVEVKTYGAVAAIAFVLSLGPGPTAWGHPLHVPGPYGWLLDVVPGLDGLRAVARLGLIVMLALAVLAAFGSAWILDRVERRARTAVLVALIAGIVAEGWAAPIPTAAFSPFDSSAEGEAYEYLRRLPAGAVLELPTSLPEFQREARYQYLTLVHGHRIVNGFSGYSTPLASFLADAQSPLNEENRLGKTLEALRGIGVRYLVIHEDLFPDPTLRAAWRTTLASERRQLLSERRFADTNVVVLLPLVPPPPLPNGPPIPVAAMRISASHSVERLPLLFDGDLDSRWLTGKPQIGDEWVELEFDRPRDIAGVRMRLAQRSSFEYPRNLVIESVTDGTTVILFEGPVLPALFRGVIVDGAYPAIDIALPPNRSGALRLRQTGTTRRLYWSIHELQLWDR